MWACRAFISGEPMNIPHRLSACAVVVSVALGLTYTSLEAAHLGKYTTRVQESQLFVDGGSRLRCDLFFSTPDGKTAVAEKDSLIAQQVPAFVWQFSGLLPVSDYLKTVAIHSVATDQKIERWQEVQNTFYHGLRAEGAASTDAKIAFAGAYAFAPRWPFVDLVEIPDEQKIPDSVLYSVSVTGPARKGLSIDDYRAMSRDIIDNPQNVTLQDIRGIVDAVDAGEGNYQESGLLIKLVDKLKSMGKPESVPVDLDVIKVEMETPASELQEATQADSDSWVRQPDGSAVLKKVENLAQKG